MKKIMFLLMTSSYLMAMESTTQELQPETQLETEKSAYRKRKLALLQRSIKVQELKLLIRNGDRIKFDLPDQWHTWEAFIKTDIQAIFNTHLQEFSGEQLEGMEQLVTIYKKQVEKEKEFMATEASQK